MFITVQQLEGTFKTTIPVKIIIAPITTTFSISIIMLHYMKKKKHKQNRKEIKATKTEDPALFVPNGANFSLKLQTTNPNSWICSISSLLHALTK